MREKRQWVLIDKYYKWYLPDVDCYIWITRILNRERIVQKVKYYSKTKDIQWDGTVAWQIADDSNYIPEPCKDKKVVQVQLVRRL